MSDCVDDAILSTNKPVCNTHSLNGKWVLYNHLPSEKNWSLCSYNIIMSNIDTVEKMIAINRALPENMIKFSMLFLMREGITPLWEDEQNKNGGCFSYKVINKNVLQVWRHMMYLLAGESLATQTDYNANINGITISPKKNFCIIKIWMKSSKFQDPQMVACVDNLTKHGSMFKRHGDA